MNVQNPTIVQPTAPPSIFNSRNYIILALVILLVFSFSGVNILMLIGQLWEQLRQLFGPILDNVLGLLGYSSGILINQTADVGADAVKLGADVAEGALQSAGNLLITASKPLIRNADMSSLDNVLISQKPNPSFNPQPDESGSVTQMTHTGKQKWCLVEDIASRRKCLGVEESQKCMSGQVFETQSACIKGNAPSPSHA
jgi:hypothetical protein